MTGWGRSSDQREEWEIGFLQPEPPSMLAALPQAVAAVAQHVRPAATEPTTRSRRSCGPAFRPMKARFSAPLRRFSAKIIS